MKTMKTKKKKHSLLNKTLLFNKGQKTRKHSNNGMMTAIWGPSTWHLLHSISFNYPVTPCVKDKVHYRNFILSLQNVLPCGKCRDNLYKNFKLLPLKKEYMESRDLFSKYIYDLHELVNTMLCKKSGLTYEDVRSTFENYRAKCIKKSNEIGCIVPLHGTKQKCIIQIVNV